MRQRESRSMSPRREESNTSESQDLARTSSRQAHQDQNGHTKTPDTEESNDEELDDEDLCPVCHLLLYNPVTTRCNHTLCSTCMAHWADVSMTSQMTILAPSSSPTMFSGADTEARCPMCRTPTSATPNPNLETQLQQKYPTTYPARAAEETSDKDFDTGVVEETLTLCIGNTHTLVSPAPESRNMHQWTFFVRPSRTDIISSVDVQLHPTFRPSRIRLQQAPYEVRRKGWGYFVITTHVILKPGWSWVSEDAEEVPFRGDRAKARLPLDWTLDFSGHGGRGSMGRCRLKVRREGEAEKREREEEERADDGRWEVEMMHDDDDDDDEDEDEEV